MIKLQSSDGEVFEVDVEIAKAANTIKTMIEGGSPQNSVWSSLFQWDKDQFSFACHTLHAKEGGSGDHPALNSVPFLKNLEDIYYIGGVVSVGVVLFIGMPFWMHMTFQQNKSMITRPSCFNVRKGLPIERLRPIWR